MGITVSAAGGRAGQAWPKVLRQALAALGKSRQAWASVQPTHAEVSEDHHDVALVNRDGQLLARRRSVFPAPFTLEAAGAVAGRGAAPAVLRLVECSLLVPPRPGQDGRMRYGTLDTLRGYGAGLLAGAGEQDQAQAALARYALGVAEEAGAGVCTAAAEAAGTRWLDAEDATMGHVSAWAVEHDLDIAARMVAALGVWWMLRGRLAGQQPLLLELAGRAGPGSQGWCAAHALLAWSAFESADVAQALQHSAAVIDAIGDREPSRPLADSLTVQSETLSNLGRIPEAAAAGRRALAMARELGYPFGQGRATACLVLAALYADDLDEAAQLARQAGQIPDIPGTAARPCGFLLAKVLAEAGDLAAAGQACAATLAGAQNGAPGPPTRRGLSFSGRHGRCGWFHPHAAKG